MDLVETELEQVDWIRMAQNRDRWKDLADTVRNFQVAYEVRNS
jgi:hypothetical protein